MLLGGLSEIRCISSSTPGPQACPHISWLKAENMADTDKATQPGRVIVHDPFFNFPKQSLTAPIPGKGVFHVGLDAILQNSP